MAACFRHVDGFRRWGQIFSGFPAVTEPPLFWGSNPWPRSRRPDLPSTGVSQVVPYDSAWPAQAKEETTRLPAALGQRVREIEHIASTAVPGLAAKPIIDLQAGIVKPTSVRSSAVADAYSGSGRVRASRRSRRAGTPMLPPPTACRDEPKHRLDRKL
jgi:hypothetical protein